MMNPDIDEPEWKAKREVKWEKFYAYMRDEYKKKQIDLLKPYFMTGEWMDYSDQTDYGVEFLDYRKDRYTLVRDGEKNSYELSPFQTESLWRCRMEEKISRVESEKEKRSWYEGFVQTESGLTSGTILSDFKGWDVSTEIELFHFFMGECYQAKDYKFHDYCIFPKHPVDAEKIFLVWLEKISSILTRSITMKEIKGVKKTDNKWLALSPYALGTGHCFDDYFQSGEIKNKRYKKNYRYTWKRILNIFYLLSEDEAKISHRLDGNEDFISYREFEGDDVLQKMLSMLSKDIEAYAPTGMKIALEKVRNNSDEALYQLD